MRRELRFSTLKDVREELDRLDRNPVATTGNWSYFQILNHCAKATESSMTAFAKMMPWWTRRAIGPIALRKLFKQGFIPPGAGPKGKVERIEGDEKAAMARLRKALDDFEGHQGSLSEHPFFGKLDKDKWTRLHSLHMANHLGWARTTEKR